MIPTIYKSREEEKLINIISSSKLITKKQLLKIKTLYSEKVPYHNFVHALNVAHRVLLLPREDYSIIEIQSLFIAALFHDAGHSGVASDLDEFRSLDYAFEGIINFEKEYNYEGIDYSIVRKAIIGTVFKNRASNTNKYAILMADLDVSIIGMSFEEFLYYNDFPFSCECNTEIGEWLEDTSFFKFLINIDKNIFRSASVRKLFPKYFTNIKRYLQTKPLDIQELYQYWSNNDITFEEFKLFLIKHLK